MNATNEICMETLPIAGTWQQIGPEVEVRQETWRGLCRSIPVLEGIGDESVED